MTSEHLYAYPRGGEFGKGDVRRMVPQLVEIRVKTVLNRVRGMGFRWSVNPYRGCAHGCPFCYARRTHWFMDQDGVKEWSTKVFVKVNAPELLRAELRRPSWKRELVAVGTATDPYQPAEARYRITRGVLQALLECRTPVNLVTRSPLVLRDVDVLAELARTAGVTVCVSVATLDPHLARRIEPTVALPHHRLRTVAELSRAGIRTGVMLAPVLPGLTDDPKAMEAVYRAASEAGAHFVWYNVLHLGEVARDAFFGFLRAHRPELVPVYQGLYPKRYAPASYRRRVAAQVAECERKVHMHPPRPFEPPRAPEQLALL